MNDLWMNRDRSSSSSSIVEHYRRTLNVNDPSSSSSLIKRNPQEESLLVFGYSCKLYRDDEKAKWINSGQQLIPWMNDQDLLIDRYDVRGYLHDLSELNNPNTTTITFGQNLTDEEEQEIETLLNAERFRDLDDTNNSLMNESEIQKESKNNTGQYSNVAYSYSDNDNDGKTNEKEQEERSDYKVPKGLNIPEDIVVLPTSLKHHQVIEKTAEFVAQHGLQMEILLKTKQSSNTNFEFLSIDSKLNPYYKHLLSEIKSGHYLPNQKCDPNDQSNDDDDDDSDDGSYLHPSLISSSSKTKTEDDNVQINIPNVFINDEHSKNDANQTSYSRLVKNFKDKFAQDIQNDEPKQEQDIPVQMTDVSSLIPKPPKEIEVVINKLAEHVGQNGEQFEQSIKALNDKKFDFLNNGHRFHAFYVKRKIHFINLYKEKQQQKQCSKTSKTSIAFSIQQKKFNKKDNVKIKDNLSVQNDLQDDDGEDGNIGQQDDQDILEQQTDIHKQTTNKSIDDKQQKLQEIRKRKALEFLKKLQNEKRLSEVINPSRSTIGPELPKPEINVELSPTIERVTSPTNSPLRSQQQSDEDEDFEIQIENKKKDDDKCRISNKTIFSKIDISNSPPRRYRDRISDDDGDDRSPSPRSTSSRHHHHRRHRDHHRKRHRSKDSPRKHRSRTKDDYDDDQEENRKRKHRKKSSRRRKSSDSDDDSSSRYHSRHRRRHRSSSDRSLSRSRSSSRSSLSSEHSSISKRYRL